MSRNHHHHAKYKDACHDSRGTQAGWQLHKTGNGTPCRECTAAHRDYLADLFRQYGPICEPTHTNPARQAFCENYVWLIMTGETNAEVIARRLGCNSVATMERHLYRVGLHPLHESVPRVTRERVAA
jgi:hypothetical protein